MSPGGATGLALRYAWSSVVAPMEPCTAAIRPALSFVACVSHVPTLRRHLLASPILAAGSEHELIVVQNCPSAAHGLNIGIERAKHDWIVCLHQDVVLPSGWDRIAIAAARRGRETIRPDWRGRRVRRRTRDRDARTDGLVPSGLAGLSIGDAC